MSKKLLSEAQIRRFQSLANMPVLSERAYAKKDDEKDEYGNKAGPYSSTNPDEIDDDGHARVRSDLYPTMQEEEEMGPEPMEPEMEPMDAPGGDLDLTEEEARVIIELGKKLEGIMGAEMDDMEAAAELDGAEDAMDMPEPEPEDMLEGISVEPSRKEVVEEVARRVARRLNEAKRAQRRLNRALGNK